MTKADGQSMKTNRLSSGEVGAISDMTDSERAVADQPTAAPHLNVSVGVPP